MPLPEKEDPKNPQHKENFNERSNSNPNEFQGETPSDHRMTDQNPELEEEEDMKDTIPEGLNLLGLKDACTRKSFNLIPPKQIQFLQKSLTKSKAQNQLGVASSGQKDKQKAQRDLKKGFGNMLCSESTI